MTDELEALRAENEALKALLRPRTKFDPRWGLSGHEEQVLGLLYQRGEATYDQLVVCIGAAPGEAGYQVVTSCVFRLRVKLRKQKIDIKTVRSFGYYLADEDKPKVAAGIVSAGYVEK